MMPRPFVYRVAMAFAFTYFLVLSVYGLAQYLAWGRQ